MNSLTFAAGMCFAPLVKRRATSLGVYRFWRDLGFVFGALGVGFLADLFGANTAIHSVAWIALASGIFVFLIMRETVSKKA